MAIEAAAAENAMEARIARLESDVGHLCLDVAEIKVDLRGLRNWLDVKLDKLVEQMDAKFDRLDTRLDKSVEQMDAKFDGLDAKLDKSVEQLDSKIDRLDTKLDKSVEQLSVRIDAVKDALGSAKVWALMLYFTLAAGVFGTMARAFGWI
jgi:predicted RNase H-like nuclease (RuvC/YqgF family)